MGKSLDKSIEPHNIAVRRRLWWEDHEEGYLFLCVRVGQQKKCKRSCRKLYTL